jgi:perosamine synthetase
MPDMSAIRRVADRHGIAVVEDAAEAIGSRYDGRAAGSFGDLGVFSFHGSKTVTTGEGGMLVTNRDDVFARVRVLRDHGRQPGDISFVSTEVAYKYKMSSLQAAFGLAQLERIDELVERKRRIFRWYEEAEPPGTLNSYWMVTAILDRKHGLDKIRVIATLAERAISCRPIFAPLSSLPAFANHPSRARAQAVNEVSYALAPYGVNLPSALNLDEDTVRYVVDNLQDVLARGERAA